MPSLHSAWGGGGEEEQKEKTQPLHVNSFPTSY